MQVAFHYGLPGSEDGTSLFGTSSKTEWRDPLAEDCREFGNVPIRRQLIGVVISEEAELTSSYRDRSTLAA